MCDLLNEVKMRRTIKRKKLHGILHTSTLIIVIVTMSRYQTEVKADSRTRPSTDRYDCTVCT